MCFALLPSRVAALFEIGSIVGSVRDASGAAIPDATVIVKILPLVW